MPGYLRQPKIVLNSTPLMHQLKYFNNYSNQLPTNPQFSIHSHPQINIHQVNTILQQIDILAIVFMDAKPTKQVPGIRVPLQSEILNELRMLDPKRFSNTVSFFGGHPLSLVKKDENTMFSTLNKETGQSPYLICEKTDGVRYLLIVTNESHYFVSRQGKFNLVAYRSECQMAKNWHRNPWGEFKQIIHILDGEMINDKYKNGEQKLRYLIFDALVVFNRKIIDRPLKKRLQLCEKVMNCNQYLLGLLDNHDQPAHPIQIKVKDFFRLTCNTFASSDIIQKRQIKQPTTSQFLQEYYIHALPHENDGFIFNHDEMPYLLGPNQGYLKWKPSELNTVDFLVVPNTKLQGKFLRRVLDLYLGWRDSEISTIYRMMFYNFTIVSESEFADLQNQLQVKYEAVFNEDPDLVLEDSFGIIAECKYNKVQPNSQEAQLFKQLLSSTKPPSQIHEHLMRQQNEQKQLAVIQKVQGQPNIKYWKIFRIRNDKNMPNNHEVVFKIEQSIKDDIKYEELVAKNRELNDMMRIG